MTTLAFIVVAGMLAAYVLLDGYDLGLGAVTPLVAKSDAERLLAMKSIGPFWNGNEVFLIAGAAALFAFFPRAYASSFSGFYLPFMIVLWLLMGRGIAMELREHFPSPVWHQFWDGCFAIASALLMLLFGVALGNLIRGVPLDHDGYFSGTFTFLLNWYALLVGIFAVAALALHGLIFLILRTSGGLTERARRMASRLWVLVVVLLVAVTAGTVVVHPAISVWAYALGILALLALIAVRITLARGFELGAYVASSKFLGLLIAAAATTMFPYIIPAFPASSGGLSIAQSASSPVSLVSALGVTIVGMLAVVIYGSVVWRMLAGKVHAEP